MPDAEVVWDWDHLCGTVGPALVRAGVARYGISAQDAEDLVQGLFERILVRRPRARSVEAYLRVSFYHACIDFLRRRRHVAPPAAFEPGVDPGPRLEAAIAVEGAFRLISPACRTLIRAYCLEELTLAETASQVGGTVNAVWKRIDRCLGRLLQCLK